MQMKIVTVVGGMVKLTLSIQIRTTKIEFQMFLKAIPDVHILYKFNQIIVNQIKIQELVQLNKMKLSSV